MGIKCQYLLYYSTLTPIHIPEDIQKSSDRMCGMFTAFSCLAIVVLGFAIILAVRGFSPQMNTASEGYDDSSKADPLYTSGKLSSECAYNSCHM